MPTPVLTETILQKVCPYDQLVKKSGYIPEQVSEESFVLHKRIRHMQEKLVSADENISSSLETVDSDSHYMELEDNSGNMEHAVSADDESASEVTFSTVDETSDEDSPERRAYFSDYSPRMYGHFIIHNSIKESIDKTFIFEIKDIFSQWHIARTLKPEENYETVRIFPDGRMNYYCRRRDIRVETIKCYNLPDYFVCIIVPRSEYSRCLNTTVFTGPRKGKFFPEEFDPEFGARWYETKPKEAYLFKSWVHQSIGDASDQLSNKSASGTEEDEARNVTVGGKVSKDGVKLLDADADTHIVSRDALSLKILKDSDVHEFKAETIMPIFKVFTTALPSTSEFEINNLLPENMAEALTNLYESKRVSLENVNIRLDNLGNIYIFWNNQQESIIDTITCGKVNECHPKGESMCNCAQTTY